MDAEQTRETISDNVSRLLKLRGESTHSLAKKSGVSQKLVYSTASGIHSPTIDSLAKVAKALGTDARALMTKFDMASDLERSGSLFRSVDKLLAISPGDREAVLTMISRFNPEVRD